MRGLFAHSEVGGWKLRDTAKRMRKCKRQYDVARVMQNMVEESEEYNTSRK